MKIAITDFDGTLKPFDDKIPQSTIDAIHQWRNAGNKFGIATGRELSMLNHDLRHYDITTDFLICVNGAVVFDRDRNILQSMRIARPLKERLIDLPLIKNFSGAMICFCERHCYSIRLYPEMSLELAPPIKLIDSLDLDDVVQYGIRFETPEQASEARLLIEQSIPELRGNQNRIYLDINVRPVDKKFGVDSLLDKMNWRDCEVLTIGDDKNDLPMITAFNGFTVARADDLIKKSARRFYNSVGEMLMDNL